MARNSNFDDMIKRTYKSVDMAFQRSSKRVGITQDPDLMLYNTLTSEEFARMAQDFGETDVLQYIQDMEKKRLLE